MKGLSSYASSTSAERPETAPQRRLIVTADDFGLSPAVNEAVEIAHRQGILGAASLMVGAPAAADAVVRAHRLPQLRVGLHLVLVDGRPVLPAAQVPDLVDADGCFSTRLVEAGIRFFFVPRVRRQLEAEVRAQFEAFRATGLALDHANAHKHMHLHPTVLTMLLRVGRDYGLRAVRLPREPVGTAPTNRSLQLAWSAFIAPWMGLLQHRLGAAGIRCNQFVFGLSNSGAMVEDTVISILQRLPAGLSELYFHPALADATPDPGQLAAAAELAALTSPRVRAALVTGRIETICFSDLA